VVSTGTAPVPTYGVTPPCHLAPRLSVFGEPRADHVRIEDVATTMGPAGTTCLTVEPTSGRHGGLLVARAQSVLARGHLAEARGLFGEAVAAAEAEGDDLTFADAALGSAGIWLNEHRSMTDADHVVGLLRRALARLPHSEHSRRLRLEARLTAEEAYRNGTDGSVRELVERSRRLGDPGAHAEVLSLVHHLLLAPRQAQRRVVVAKELIAAAMEADEAVLALIGQCWRTVDLFLLGDPLAERMHAALRRRAEALGMEAIGFVADAIDVMRTIRAGRLQDAEDAAERCFTRGAAVGDADALGFYGAQLVVIRWLQGRTAEVLSAVEEFASSPTLAECEFGFAAAAASVAASCGETDRARAALDRLTACGLASIPESSTWLTTMYTVADAAHALGDADVAGEVYSLLAPYAELPVMASLAVVCLGSTHRALGVAALTFGDVERAIVHLESAVTANRRLGNRPFAVIAAADLAEALLRRDGEGDRERAVDLLRDAAAEAAVIGMAARGTRWAERADTAERQVGRVRARGRHWLVELGREQALVPDRVGMRYLTRLLGDPGVEVLACALAGGSVPDSVADCVLDDDARSAYRKRIEELTAELERADRLGLPARSTQAQAELDAVVAHLASASGLGGRARAFANDLERARTAVTKAIRRVVEQIGSTCPALATHLRQSIVTGQVCEYTGDIRWIVSTDE
jgi:tetratricopeptide (TPR) repeat protein